MMSQCFGTVCVTFKSWIEPKSKPMDQVVKIVQILQLLENVRRHEHRHWEVHHRCWDRKSDSAENSSIRRNSGVTGMFCLAKILFFNSFVDICVISNKEREYVSGAVHK